MLSTTWARGVTLACLLVGMVRGILLAEQLPEVVPSHFGAGGQPDGYLAASSYLWTYLAVCAFTLGLLEGCSLLVHRLPPSLFNLPDKEQWLASGRFDEVRAVMGQLLSALTAATAIILLVVFELTVFASLQGGGLPMLPFSMAFGGYLLFTFYSIAWLTWRLRYRGD